MAWLEKPTFRVNAVDAPFEAKERLKSRGYRWASALRFWWKAIAEADKEAWLLSDGRKALVRSVGHDWARCTVSRARIKLRSLSRKEASIAGTIFPTHVIPIETPPGVRTGFTVGYLFLSSAAVRQGGEKQ